MKMKNYVFVSTFFATSVLSTLMPDHQRRAQKCDTEDPTAWYNAHRLLASTEKNRTSPCPHVNVDVYMHVILKSETDANVTLQSLQAQVDALNTNFQPANFAYNLRAADWTVEPTWTVDNEEMKSVLHRGGANSLNVYFPESVERGLRAHSSSPLDADDSGRLMLDGIVMAKYKADQIDEALTHEVGHWQGLLHTFQDVCVNGDDFINDTPPTPKSCEDDVSQCPGGNFMDYSDDPQPKKFTNGQIVRMHSFWETYRSRAKKVTISVEPALLPLEPASSQTRRPFYPKPQNTRVVRQKCKPKSDGTVEENRENYCGTEAFCRWGLYKLVGERYRNEAECLRVRSDAFQKLRWIMPTADAQDSLSHNLILEGAIGTEEFCKVFDVDSEQYRIVVDAQGNNSRGKYGSRADCLNSYEKQQTSD
ncbi:Extracellular metalloprotease 1 [Beauveria bassiana]|nr:Extracellular metalloprotease 1 [Beauveria bassiana]KAH8708335.1 Extracellular metalloprotease 1 [Beauveria bassiana]